MSGQEKEKTPAAIASTETPAAPPQGPRRKRRWLPKKFRPNIFLARHWSDSIQAKLPAA